MIDLILVSHSLSSGSNERKDLVQSASKLINLSIADLQEPICFELLWQTRSNILNQMGCEVYDYDGLT